jgi:DNA-binding response OmpR family regulator
MGFKRVLIVDDFPDAAAATEMMLSLRGYDCQIALSGREALELAAAFEPQLAILDIGLPDVSGFELARQLRTRAGGKPIHIAAVTGWSDPETRARAIEAGFDQHVTKPTDRHKIDEILRAAAEQLTTAE